MTSKEDFQNSLAEDRSRHPFDCPPQPANSSKPLTSFSIEDILNKPIVTRNYIFRETAHLLSVAEELTHHAVPLTKNGIFSHISPLCALEELASKTFKGLEVSVLQAAEGRDGTTVFGQRNTPKKRRKSRTAFTNHQIYELEKRFLYQKYLSPADRDQIAQHLGLSNAQVITWFQNRRAKLKRDLEEMKADVQSAKTVGSIPLEKTADFEKCVSRTHGNSRAESPALFRCNDKGSANGKMSPSSSFTNHTSKQCSEEEDVEIDVDE